MKIAVIDSGWDYNVNTPYNKPLGGTQSAICYFLFEMKQLGHDMYLFNNIKEETIIDNITHRPYSMLNINDTFDIIIASCIVTDLVTIKMKMNKKDTLYCLWTGHDIDQSASKLLECNKMKDMVDLFIFVSNWQQKRYIEKYNIKAAPRGSARPVSAHRTRHWHAVALRGIP